MYATGSLCSIFCFATTMLCRLFGKPDITKFSLEQLPLEDVAINATIMNWTQILSDNFSQFNFRVHKKKKYCFKGLPSIFDDNLCYGCYLFWFQIPYYGMEVDYSKSTSHSNISQSYVGTKFRSTFFQNLSQIYAPDPQENLQPRCPKVFKRSRGRFFPRSKMVRGRMVHLY